MGSISDLSIFSQILIGMSSSMFLLMAWNVFFAMSLKSSCRSYLWCWCLGRGSTGGWWQLNWGGRACGNGWSRMSGMYQIHQTHCSHVFDAIPFAPDIFMIHPPLSRGRYNYLCALGQWYLDSICICCPGNWTFFWNTIIYVLMRFTVRAKVWPNLCRRSVGPPWLGTEAPDHQQTVSLSLFLCLNSKAFSQCAVSVPLQGPHTAQLSMTEC